jgi:hypothetical protein
VVRRQGIEPRTNGLRVRWRAFNHAGFTPARRSSQNEGGVYVHQDVASWGKVVASTLMLSIDAGFGMLFDWWIRIVWLKDNLYKIFYTLITEHFYCRVAASCEVKSGNIRIGGRRWLRSVCLE